MRYYFRLLKRFFSFGAVNGKLLFHLIFSACLREMAFLTLPFIASEIIGYATNGDFGLVFIYIGLFLVAALVYVACHHYNYWAYAQNACYIHDALQRKILEKVVTLDQDYAKNISHATIISTAFEDVTENQRIPDYLFDFVTNIASIFINAIILVFVDPLIGGMALGLTLISMTIFVLHMKKRICTCPKVSSR